MDLIKPKEISIEDIDGDIQKYTISRVPATVGREILANYPINLAPKVGDYKVNEKMMLKLISYVAVQLGDKQQKLETKGLIDNHCPDPLTLMRLEMAMLEYNTNFFASGKISKSLDGLGQIVQQWIIKTLTGLSGQSSQPTKPSSMN